MEQGKSCHEVIGYGATDGGRLGGLDGEVERLFRK